MNEEHRDESLTAQIKDVLDAARPSQIPWITWILLLINTLVFLIETLLAFSLQMYPTFWKWVLVSRDAQPLLIMMGALVPETISQPWRVVTALFLHVGLVHYALSMLGLWTFRRVEHSMGGWNYLVIYFTGGIVGNVAAALLTFLVAPDTPFMAGASSALFSVGTVSLLEFSTTLASRGRGRSLSCFLLFLWVLWIAPMFAGNPFAHGTGALCGGLIGVFRLLRRRHNNERKMKQQGQ